MSTSGKHRTQDECLSAAVADVNTTATNICAMKLKSVSEVTQKKACVNGNAIHGPSRKGSKPPQFANTTSGKTTLCTTAVDAPSQFRFGTVASNDRTANVGSDALIVTAIKERDAFITRANIQSNALSGSRTCCLGNEISDAVANFVYGTPTTVSCDMAKADGTWRLR